jgi:3-oxoacyl-[acyl-carrier-protein] synthase III
MSDVTEFMPGLLPRTESGRSRLGKPIPLHFASVGSYVPPTVVTNDDLSYLGCDSQWLVQRTGIHERRFAGADQASSDLAYFAAVDCLDRAGRDAKSIDLLIVATITPDYPTPSTACVLQRRLGCTAAALDVSAACSGFVYGLMTGAQFIGARGAQNALVVGAEVMSRTVSPEDLKTYPLFGDGAGAVLLQAMDSLEGSRVGDAADGTAPPGTGILAYTLGSEGNLEALCTPGGGSREPLTPEGLAAGRQYMRMDGREVFKWAVRCIVDSCRDVMAAAGRTMDDVDLLVLHQANWRIIDAAIRELGIPREKAVINLDRYGNTAAASIPLALSEADREGKMPRGSLVLVCGFGAGLTWGSVLLRW